MLRAAFLPHGEWRAFAKMIIANAEGERQSTMRGKCRRCRARRVFRGISARLCRMRALAVMGMFAENLKSKL
jgi:hypothetical protein